MKNHNGPIVIKVGGALLDSPAEASAVCGALARIHSGWPAGVVVVHGGGSEVDRHLTRLGFVSQKRAGIRVSPAEHIEEIVGVLAGKMNKRLVGQILQHDVAAVGLCLGDGFLLHTVKAAHHGFDAGHVGCAVGGDPLLIETLLTAGFMPVLSSIGLDVSGAPLNVNADDAAADLAKLLGASNLILLTNVSGVLDATGAVIPELTADEIEMRIESGEIRDGMIPKVKSAMAVTEESSIPVTIASWRQVDAFQGDCGSWFGTRIRPATTTAKPSRLPAVLTSPNRTSRAIAAHAELKT